MRFFSRANRQERLRQRAVVRGELIDVTHTAREAGIYDNVYITKRLWMSIMRPFPFAEPNDCVSLSMLSETLKASLQSNANHGVLYLLPGQAPKWFRGACYFKYMVNTPLDGPRSVVVQPYSDLYPNYVVPAEPTCPASLLVRLAKTLRNLVFVSRTAEQGLLRSMQTVITQLIQANPFHREIDSHLGPFPSEVSLPFPPDEYRPVLLADLDELLAILAQCLRLKICPRSRP